MFNPLANHLVRTTYARALLEGHSLEQTLENKQMDYLSTSFGSLISSSTLKKIARRIKIGDSFEQINDEEIIPIIGHADFGVDDEAWEIYEHCEKLAQTLQ